MTSERPGIAMLSLSQTQRRLAHEARREAQEAERHGNLPRYRAAVKEHARLWKASKFYLAHARMDLKRIAQ